MLNVIAHSIKGILYRPDIDFGGYWPFRSKNTKILSIVSTNMKVCLYYSRRDGVREQGAEEYVII